jgi:hypothetical protein
MADFAQMAQAAEPALGLPRGAALAAYRRNILGATELIVKTDSVAIAVEALIKREARFEGLMSVLLERLNNNATLDTRQAKGWPKNAAGLGGKLRRIAPAMRNHGILIEFPRCSAGSWVKIASDVGPV